MTKKIDEVLERYIIWLRLSQKLSVRKIAQELKLKTGTQVSKSLVHKVLINHKRRSADKLWEKLCTLLDFLCDSKDESTKKTMLFVMLDEFLNREEDESYHQALKLIENNTKPIYIPIENIKERFNIQGEIAGVRFKGNQIAFLIRKEV